MDLEDLGSLYNVQLAVYNYYFLMAQPCLHQICFIHSRRTEFSVDFFAQNNGTALTSRFTMDRASGIMILHNWPEITFDHTTIQGGRII